MLSTAVAGVFWTLDGKLIMLLSYMKVVNCPAGFSFHFPLGN